MPRERFDEQYDPQTKYKVKGSWLNKVARHLNATGQGPHGGPNVATQFNEGGHLQAYNPPSLFGVAVIQETDHQLTGSCGSCLYEWTGEYWNVTNQCTHELCDCPDVPATDGEFVGQTVTEACAQTTEVADSSCPVDEADSEQDAPPCRRKHLYTCRFRYYDFDERSWLEYDEDLRLDAGGLYEPSDTQASAAPTSEQDYGPIPRFSKGDVVPCYWDEQRGYLIPLAGIPQEEPSHEFWGQTAVVPAAGQEHMRAVCMLQRQTNPGVDQWITVAYVYWFLQPLTSDQTAGIAEEQVIALDTRSGQGTTRAEHGTKWRIALQNMSQYWQVQVTHYRAQLTMIGRTGIENDPVDVSHEPKPSGTPNLGTWQDGSHVQGRFHDAPNWTLTAGDDEVTLEFEDELDEGIFRVELFAELKATLA